MSRTIRVTSSTPLRDLMKQIVRAPSRTSSATIVGRLARARCRACRSASSTSGGFHIAIWRAAPGRAVAVHERDVVQAGQALGQLDRVGDRRAGEQEARLGPVRGGDAPQPPQDVRDVRAEHAAVDVRLVDDDDGEVGEEVRPRGVVGQDPDVEHVGVREDEVRPPADRGALLARRVAVVDRRAHLLAAGRARRSRAPGPGPAPSSGRGRARAPSRRGRARRASAG